MAEVSALRDSRVYYGICSTDKDETGKIIDIYNPVFIEKDNVNYLDLEIGDELIVNFIQGNKVINPNLILRIKDTAQNITSSNDSSSEAVIIGTGDTYYWREDSIVSFIFTEIKVSGEGSVDNPIVTYVNKWKVNNRTKVANHEFSGLTRIANKDEEVPSTSSSVSAFISPTCALTKSWIEQAVSNMGLTIALDNSTGKRTITLSKNNSNKGVTIPKIPTKTSELSNTGETGKENEKFFSNIRNSAYLTPGLGLGHRYWVKENGVATPKVLREFRPHVLNEDGTINWISIGYDGLKQYQLGTKDINGKKVSPDPRTYVNGKYIRMFFDEKGELEIGYRNIPKDTYKELYTFTPTEAKFNNNLIINGRLYCTGITFIGSGKTITEFVDGRVGGAIKYKTYSTKKLTYSAGSSTPSQSKTYSVDGKTDSPHLALEIDEIEGYTPIAIGGFNLDEFETKDTPTKVFVFECFVQYNETKKRYYIRFGLTNTAKSSNSVTFHARVLYRKNS